MITRMMLSLKRASTKGLGQSWIIEENGSGLDPPTGPRMLRGVRHFSSSMYAQFSDVIPIPMETIHTMDD